VQRETGVVQEACEDGLLRCAALERPHRALDHVGPGREGQGALLVEALAEEVEQRLHLARC